MEFSKCHREYKQAFNEVEIIKEAKLFPAKKKPEEREERFRCLQVQLERIINDNTIINKEILALTQTATKIDDPPSTVFYRLMFQAVEEKILSLFFFSICANCQSRTCTNQHFPTCYCKM